jgi:hypothetical protein
MMLGRSKTGEYVDTALCTWTEPKRYTVYVFYADNPEEQHGDWKDIVEHNRGGIEEIDVDAAGVNHAKEIATAAIEKDYVKGGRIVAVEERFGLYF